MSQQYDEYLQEHISNVNKAWMWMEEHGIIPPHMAYEGALSKIKSILMSEAGDEEEETNGQSTS